MPIQLGILTLYVGHRKRLEERRYLADCCREGEKLGLEVMVFTPEDVNRRSRTVRAHLYSAARGNWYRAVRSLPTVIFDRCRFQSTPRFRQLRQFRRDYRELTFLNHPLANKWLVHETLRKHRELEPMIPQTRSCTSVAGLRSFCSQHRSVYVKPVNGTGGRGILRLRVLGSGLYELTGRDQARRIIRRRTGSLAALSVLTMRKTAGGHYLMQQGIDIGLQDGSVHDYRLIVQKNARGEWAFTGGAARVGKRGSITSNLHGGGRAVAMADMLRSRFSQQKALEISQQMQRMSLSIAAKLEQHYGRLCELGLDIAVDRTGKPWLLEINPKPAREIFRKLGRRETYLTAVRRPLEYGKWLAKSGRRGNRT